MPSGSGFSGGGHFGGGFSGGHGHSSSSWSSSRSRGTVNGHSVVIFNGFGGRRYYVSNGVSSGMSIMSFFAFFLFVLALILLSTGYSVAGQTAQEIEIIKQDYAKYQNMIKTAENNNEYMLLTTDENAAVITKQEKCDRSDKYFLRYEFEDKNGYIVEGYTFCTYTKEDMLKMQYQEGQKIQLALSTKKDAITQNTNSIDYNYKYTTIEDDGDYIALKNKDVKGMERGFKLGGFFALLGGIALIVMSVVMYYKKRKIYEENQKAEEVAKQKAEEAARPKSNFCVYCGAKIPSQDIKCPSCGASVQKDSLQ